MTNYHNYHNPESDSRRHIKRLIEKEDLESLKLVGNLTPSCPYHNYGPLDPIYFAINLGKSFMIPYLVEERNLKSKNGLKRALECEDLETASYLYDKKFPLNNGNHVYSLEVMKLVTSWGYTFNDQAFGEIITIWHDGNSQNVIEQLKYLFQLISIPLTIESYNLKGIDDLVACYLLDYTDPILYLQIMEKAIEKKWLLTINKLRLQGLPFTLKDLKQVANSTNYSELEKIRKDLSVELEELYPFIFSTNKSFVKNFNHYVKDNHSLNHKNFAIKYDLMNKACSYGFKDIILYLIDQKVPITVKNVEDLFAYECQICDRGYEWPLVRTVIEKCPSDIKIRVNYILEQIDLE